MNFSPETEGNVWQHYCFDVQIIVDKVASASFCEVVFKSYQYTHENFRDLKYHKHNTLHTSPEKNGVKSYLEYISISTGVLPMTVFNNYRVTETVTKAATGFLGYVNSATNQYAFRFLWVFPGVHQRGFPDSG